MTTQRPVRRNIQPPAGANKPTSRTRANRLAEFLTALFASSTAVGSTGNAALPLFIPLYENPIFRPSASARIRNKRIRQMHARTSKGVRN